METGELIKLTIQGYKTATFSENDKVGSQFETLINPEKISLSHKVEYDSKQAENTTKVPHKFVRMVPPDLDLSILFDATGVIPGSRRTKDVRKSGEYYSVTSQIKDFESVVLAYKGEQHKPNHIWVIWGDLDFQGVLQDYSIEYKIFNPNGTPLRAVAKLKLKEATAEEIRAAQEAKESPDLTHIRQVVEGDTLPLLCNSIYGNSKYYLEVARVNNITNFRKLEPGQRVSFPPLEKLSK